VRSGLDFGEQPPSAFGPLMQALMGIPNASSTAPVDLVHSHGQYMPHKESQHRETTEREQGIESFPFGYQIYLFLTSERQSRNRKGQWQWGEYQPGEM